MFAVLATPPLEPPFLPVSFDRKTTAFGAFFFVAMAKSLLLPFISCGYPISSHTFLTIMPEKHMGPGGFTQQVQHHDRVYARWGDSSCVDLQAKTVLVAQAGIPFVFFLAQLRKRSILFGFSYSLANGAHDIWIATA